MKKRLLNRRDFCSIGAAGAVGVATRGVAATPETAADAGRMPDDVPTSKHGVNVSDDPIRIEDVSAAERLIGLSFTDEQRELMLPDLEDQLEDFVALREVSLSNNVAPAFSFDPRVGGAVIPDGPESVRFQSNAAANAAPARRPSDEDIAFMSIRELASMLRAGTVTSIELTELCLSRLDTIGRRLEAVVTLTPERALASAARADKELRAGHDRGLLHGIPYGAKDLLAVSGYRTTWGAMPYRNQTIDTDAAVITKLDEAGAVLVAKLTLGALAWGDVWFGGKTRNPWNVDQGSSGSSAGPGAAVAAGLVPFAIGSETLGSIISPATVNGVTGFRPSFGLVSRAGAMTLSWSMDKLGPMARSAIDCAIVFNAIHGADPGDSGSVNAPFSYDFRSRVDQLRVGYLAEAFASDYDNREADAQILEVVRSFGVNLRPVKFPAEMPHSAMIITLGAEAAAAFDELTRNGGVDQMVRQVRRAWPNAFRAARFIPAVEYLQANRARVELARRMHAAMQEYDVVLSPTSGGGTLGITNLTGHPTVCIPNAFRPVEGFPDRRELRSISFVGRLYGDSAALRLAAAVQEKTDHHLQRPPMT